MTTYLFSAWISHFIAFFHQIGDISLEHLHLVVLDGHNNHVTLEVVQEATATRLDLISLPFHTLHALQLLDVYCFKSFKQHFRKYRDFWSPKEYAPSHKQGDTNSLGVVGFEESLGTTKHMKEI